MSSQLTAYRTENRKKSFKKCVFYTEIARIYNKNTTKVGDVQRRQQLQQLTANQMEKWQEEA